MVNTALGASLVVPPGAVSQQTSISISQGPSDYIFEGRASNTVYRFDPSGITFQTPVQLVLPFPAGADPSKLRVFYFDETNLVWKPVPTLSIDAANRLITAETNHFTLFTVDWAPTVQFDVQLYKQNGKIAAGVTLLTPLGQIPTDPITRNAWGYSNLRDLLENKPTFVNPLFNVYLRKKINWWFDPYVTSRSLKYGITTIGNGLDDEVTVKVQDGADIYHWHQLSMPLSTVEGLFSGKPTLFRFDGDWEAGAEYYVEVYLYYSDSWNGGIPHSSGGVSGARGYYVETSDHAATFHSLPPAPDGNGNDIIDAFEPTIPANQPPVAYDQIVSVGFNTPKGITLTATDPDNSPQPLSYRIVESPMHGAVSSGSGNNRTYTPTIGYSGPDRLTFVANDGATDGNQATVSITVSSATNQAPVANSQNISVVFNTPKAITLTATDPDNGPQSLSYSIITQPSHGALTGSGASRTFTPTPGYSGPDTFTFKANDGAADSNIGTVSITVSGPGNQAPVANNQNVSVVFNTPKAITLTATDPDNGPQALSYSIVTQPSHGTLTGSGASHTFTPTPDYNGPDSFTFKANDGAADSNDALVSITVQQSQSYAWQPLGSGTNNRVRTLAVYNGEIIASGDFDQAGDQNALKIAAWNGDSWHALGSGLEGGSAFAFIVYNGELIAGGNFVIAGGVPANGIARWTGTNWHALGLGMNGAVSALAIHNGELIAGGWFTTAGGGPANYIARWNGSTWQSLGAGAGAPVLALTEYGGELIAAGYVISPGANHGDYIARWNGSAWQSVGTGTNGVVRALTVNDGLLFAGGYFSEAGDGPASFIAQWNGTSWQGVGGGLNGYVFALSNHGGELIAGGDFTVAEGKDVARWNGVSWRPVGTGTIGYVEAMTGNNGDLIAGGLFTSAGGFSANYIAKWAPAGDSATVPTPTISPSGGAFTGSVQVNLSCNDTQATIRYTSDGTNPTLASTVYVNPFTLTQSATIKARAFRTGYNNSASASATFTVNPTPTVPTPTITPNGGTFVASEQVTLGCSDSQASIRYTIDGTDPMSTSTLYAGPFTLATPGTLTVRTRAFRTGYLDSNVASATFTVQAYAWRPLGSGMNGSVYALSFLNGDLIAGGWFTTVGGQQVNNIARWNGSAWQSLGTGTDGTVVAAMTYNGDLIVGGTFSSAGGASASAIARWNGTGWQPLGMGIGGSTPYVYSLAVYNNELIAGGEFTLAGGSSASHIARWNGTNWQSLGSGVSGQSPTIVYGLTVYDGELIAGGSFNTAGGVAANNIARWNGTTWQSLGAGMNGAVRALMTHDSQLVIGGQFTTAGGVTVNNIARWNGTSWQPLTTGADNTVSALAECNGELIAGGLFSTIGGTAASRVARWNGATWQPLGTGVGGSGGNYLSTLTASNGELIAGGTFTTAGGQPANNIARWGPMP